MGGALGARNAGQARQPCPRRPRELSGGRRAALESRLPPPVSPSSGPLLSPPLNSPCLVVDYALTTNLNHVHLPQLYNSEDNTADYPWMALVSGPSADCAGSLIAPGYVLTAAQVRPNPSRCFFVFLSSFLCLHPALPPVGHTHLHTSCTLPDHGKSPLYPPLTTCCVRSTASQHRQVAPARRTPPARACPPTMPAFLPTAVRVQRQRGCPRGRVCVGGRQVAQRCYGAG